MYVVFAMGTVNPTYYIAMMVGVHMYYYQHTQSTTTSIIPPTVGPNLMYTLYTPHHCTKTVDPSTI